LALAVIEQAIYFGLGCVVAGLMALSFTPVLWARALRLTRQRLQVQIPVSMQEILADRDHLRAGFAFAARALEQEMDNVRATKAGDMSELGRRAVEIFNLSQELAEARAELESQGQEIERLTREAVEAAAGLAGLQSSLHQNHVHFEQRLENYESLKKSHWDLELALEQKRTTVGALQTRVSGLEMTIEDAERARTALSQQLDAARREAALAGEERDLLAQQLDAVHAAQETLRKRLTAETILTAKLEQEQHVLRAELDAARVRIRLGFAEIEGVGIEGAGRAGQEAKDRERASGLRHNLEAAPLNVPHEVVEGSVSDAVLRASIHSLGLAIAEMMPASAPAPAPAVQNSGALRRPGKTRARPL
jgi:predicted  nucleic acid-binding Zn-ribbon protein